MVPVSVPNKYLPYINFTCHASPFADFSPDSFFAVIKQARLNKNDLG